MGADVFEPLTRCGADTPMGRLLREYWVPTLPSSAVEADGDPYRVQLLGEHLVVFRDTQGRVGVVDEACPHRGVSMALGRNEDCGLRCLYHGWKIDVAGNVVDTPREADAEFGRRVQPSGYPTEERAGIIWTFLGELRPIPPLPDYPFVTLPEHQVATVCFPTRCNWLLGLEAAWDPTHVPVLHQSSLHPDGKFTATVRDIPPYTFEVERQPYGVRLAQWYPNGDDGVSLRMKEYIFPFLRMNPQSADDDSDIVVFGMVPMDDDNMMFWFIVYNHEHEPNETGFPTQSRGRTGVIERSFGPETNWGQDRTALGRHFTGLSLDDPALGVIVEDLTVLESMTPMLDRGRHNLSSGDGMLVKTRHLAKVFLDEHRRGLGCPDHATVGELHPRFVEIPAGDSWRDHYPVAHVVEPA